MENAHLTKAHEHARSAAAATYGSSITAAGEAHALAAVSFHEAARDTHDTEALRILALLEDHHRKLARLIKEPPRRKEKSSDEAPQAPATATSSSPPPTSSPAKATSSTAQTGSTTRVSSRRRLPQSSIASNLAEMRGIPGTRRGVPSASSVSVTTALAQRNDRQAGPVRDLLEQQSRKAQEATKEKDEARSRKKEADAATKETSPPPTDNFRRFYSAFGGVINAISAPLAFTSLPLNPSSTTADARPPSPPAKQPPSKPKPHSLESSRTIKSSEPDLSALISKPALAALRDNPSAPLGPFAKNESFYFVPTSGGTLPYSKIVRDAHHAAQDTHLDSISEGDGAGGASGAGGGLLRGSSHEEFVDARESIGPPSPTSWRRPPSSKGTGGGAAGAVGATTTMTGVTTAANIRAGRGNGLKTMEELQLENETLRGLIDKQAKRLQMWETTSQNSYNALAQSLRFRGGLRQQVSDPQVLAQALAMGANGGVPGVIGGAPEWREGKAEGGRTVSNAGRARDREKEKENESGTDKDKTDDVHAARIAELEARLAAQAKQLDTLEKEKQELTRLNERNAEVIRRYREQWERLKAGARKKEQERAAARKKAEEGVGVEGKEQEGSEGKEKEGEEDGREEGAREEMGEEETEVEEGVGFGKA
ncbi:uncharacterized protein EI97DRAFT_500002 [Westerdykella ornata]|uniref:Uncharacterized protein n=1 Tax=Westerdykella ornata TaxID=318751 RepID=A0A6A6JNE0_WESOR|nr:uncharacterized protein EI97DRAFT_500002 [Westerdykella ornata]KAF2277745.1 hypothetical protein EI97DRAFT_500002 [Westerdykella ornata]